MHLLPPRWIGIGISTSKETQVIREIQDYTSLLRWLDNVAIEEMKKNRRLWSLETSGHYSCKFYLNWMINDVSLAKFLPSKSIWKASTSPNIQVFLWERHKENQILEKWVKESSLICVYPHHGVRCAKQVLKLLIIFFFIVLWPLSCGVGYPKRLAFCGSYRVVVTLLLRRIRLLLVKEKRPKFFGTLLWQLFFGQCGRKEIFVFWREKYSNIENCRIEFVF